MNGRTFMLKNILYNVLYSRIGELLEKGLNKRHLTVTCDSGRGQHELLPEFLKRCILRVLNNLKGYSLLLYAIIIPSRIPA